MVASGRFPSLASWMRGTPPTHPLHELIETDQNSPQPGGAGRVILTAFDDIIGTLEAAKPERLSGERNDFRNAKAWNDLLIVRAELIAGAKLARHGVGFDFGRRGTKPEPDLLLRDAELAIEVKARHLNGLQDLCDELEAALAETQAPVTVHIACTERPLYLKQGPRTAIVDQTVERVRTGQLGTSVTELQQPWASTPVLRLDLRIMPQPPDPLGSRVLVEGGWELSPHLEDIESEILAVLTDEQKVAQAKAMPTILLVDAARTGVAWIRPARIWARRLADRLPDGTPFIGVAVMIPTLDNPDVPIALALRPGADPQALAAAHVLAQSLGLAEA